MLVIDRGGRDYAKQMILSWLEDTGGSNRILIETASGLPRKIVGALLAELMREGEIELDRVIFKLR